MIRNSILALACSGLRFAVCCVRCVRPFVPSSLLAEKSPISYLATLTATGSSYAFAAVLVLYARTRVKAVTGTVAVSFRANDSEPPRCHEASAACTSYACAVTGNVARLHNDTNEGKWLVCSSIPRRRKRDARSSIANNAAPRATLPRKQPNSAARVLPVRATTIGRKKSCNRTQLPRSRSAQKGASTS